MLTEEGLYEESDIKREIAGFMVLHIPSPQLEAAAKALGILDLVKDIKPLHIYKSLRDLRNYIDKNPVIKPTLYFIVKEMKRVLP